MRIIPKLLNGGFATIFNEYTPIQNIAAVPDLGGFSKSSRRRKDSDDEEESSKGKLTEKDLFTMLSKIDGLPNDMQKIVTNLHRMFQSNLLDSSLDVSNLASLYLQSLQQIKVADFNKKLYDEAYKEVVKNGGLNEYAITQTGKVVVFDNDENVKEITVEDLLNSDGDYTPLTNSNLLYLRAYQPQYSNSNMILSTVANGIGMDLIDKMIRDKIDLGTTEFESTGYSVKLNEQIVKGLLLLSNSKDLINQSGMTLDGMYKNKVLTKDLKQQAEAALNYIYNTLPTNAKTLLAIKSGNANNPKLGALSIIQQMITQKQTYTYHNDVEYEGTLDQVTKSKEDPDNLDNLKLNTATKWLAGLGDKESFDISIGTNRIIRVGANTMPITDKSGNYIGANSTLQLLTTGEYSSILDIRNASMGMKTIDTSAFDKILLTDGKISSIDYPCIERDGYIYPDLSKETYENKKKAEEEIRKQGINLNDKGSIKKNYAIINKIYRDNNLPPAYNELGELVSQKWARFGVINGKASNNALGMDQFDSNPLLEEITDDFSILNYMDATKTDEWDSHDYGLGWLGLNGVDHLYKGTIWIPIRVDYNSAMASEKITPKAAIELENRTQALLTRQNLIMGRLLQN